jgi:hypothetical protein
VVSGTCAGAGITKSFINYGSGDFYLQFSSPPANNAPIVASWTHYTDPALFQGSLTNVDWVGNGSPTSGIISGSLSSLPSGATAVLQGQCSNDATTLGLGVNNEPPPQGNYDGYSIGAVGVQESWSYVLSQKYPALGFSNTMPIINVGNFRAEAGSFGANFQTTWYGCTEFNRDFGEQSTIHGYVTNGAGDTGTLTLTSAITSGQQIWEGESIGCIPYSFTCGVPVGTYITGILSGTWGASGSTYGLAAYTTIPTTGSSGSPITMGNAVAYTGNGIFSYCGPDNDYNLQGVTTSSALVSGVPSPHSDGGIFGSVRETRRAGLCAWSLLSNAPSFAADATLSRATIAACDSSAIAAPCFDIGNTYAASATATISGKVATITGGLSAGARPFVPGMKLTCASCTTTTILSVSATPTGAPSGSPSGTTEVGATFTMTLSGNPGQAGPLTVTGGCSGTAGTGSNCIDLSFAVNTAGSYGTPAALATCGAATAMWSGGAAGNQYGIQGPVANYGVPNGVCVDNGIGELVRGFVVASGPMVNGNLAVGNWNYDDGFNPMYWQANGFTSGSTTNGFSQNSAFTCNIVAAKVVQCVLGATYSAGVYSSIGQWSSSSTYISYGDDYPAMSRAGFVLGNLGGAPIPFTAGSGYTNGQYTLTATGCAPVSAGWEPKIQVTVSGGSIVNAYPINAGEACTAAANFTLSGMGSGTGGSVGPLQFEPSDGQAGIASVRTDQNWVGELMYDNSGIGGNPLNPYFTNGNGGYYEPGMPVLPWGQELGAAVSG